MIQTSHVLFHCSPHLRSLHSFPTRRSSDLLDPPAEAAEHGDVGAAEPEDRLLLVADDGEDGAAHQVAEDPLLNRVRDRKSTRLNSSHVKISYAVFCLKKKT